MPHLSVEIQQEARSDRIELPLIEGESLLEQLVRNDVPLPHDCAGTLACGTCLVIVRKGLDSLSAANDDEQDVLDKSSATEPGSRLACQAIAGSKDLVIAISTLYVPPMHAPSPEAALPIVLSERAARHFAAQLSKRTGAAAVRLGVRPAGCSGSRYQIDYADAIGTSDAVFESAGIRIVVDSLSLPFLRGTRLDIVPEGLGQRVRFDNPNARQTCGCGESFGV